jgi:opacity protein-like surface antigen
MKARIILAAGTLGALISSSAFAEGEDTAGRSAPASGMRAAAQVEMLPLGSGKTTSDGSSMSRDTATAYGVTAMFDYAINPYLSVGVAPRLLLNVKSSDASAGETANKELDLRARITGRLPIQPGLELYAALTPGYAIVMSGQDGVNSATGFSLGGAVGATYDLTRSMFVGAEVGYQRAFTSQEQMILDQKLSLDLELSYLHVGIGAGARF